MIDSKCSSGRIVNKPAEERDLEGKSNLVVQILDQQLQELCPENVWVWKIKS